MTFSHHTACAVMFSQYNSKPLPLNALTQSKPATLLLCVLFGASSLGQGMCVICLLGEPSKVRVADVIELLFACNSRPTGRHIWSVTSRLILYKLVHWKSWIVRKIKPPSVSCTTATGSSWCREETRQIFSGDVKSELYQMGQLRRKKSFGVEREEKGKNQ